MIIFNFKGKGILFYHMLALIIAIIWGTTFTSTKILLNNGFSPAEILLFRLLMAYLSILFISHKRLLSDSLKDEFLFLCAGMAGGSVYFLTENIALELTLVANVSMLLCTAPLLTALLMKIFHRNHALKSSFFKGSIIAIIGVSFVVFNGNFLLKLNPIGDILSIFAALSWAFYGILIKSLNDRYPALLVTRKVFFYGIITLLPYFIYHPLNITIASLLRPTVIFNFIFLGFIASMLCFLVWNIVVKNIGAVSASNYIYIGPLVTMISSYVFIGESVTLIAVLGALFIIMGVFIAEKGFDLKILSSFVKINFIRLK